MPLNMETTEVDITEISEVVHHKSELVDIVDTITVNLTAAEGDIKMWPEVGTHLIKTEGEETTHLKAQSQKQHYTEEAILEFDDLHPDKQGNSV